MQDILWLAASLQKQLPTFSDQKIHPRNPPELTNIHTHWCHPMSIFNAISVFNRLTTLPLLGLSSPLMPVPSWKGWIPRKNRYQSTTNKQKPMSKPMSGGCNENCWMTLRHIKSQAPTSLDIERAHGNSRCRAILQLNPPLRFFADVSYRRLPYPCPDSAHIIGGSPKKFCTRVTKCSQPTSPGVASNPDWWCMVMHGSLAITGHFPMKFLSFFSRCIYKLYNILYIYFFREWHWLFVLFCEFHGTCACWVGRDLLDDGVVMYILRTDAIQNATHSSIHYIWVLRG